MDTPLHKRQTEGRLDYMLNLHSAEWYLNTAVLIDVEFQARNNFNTHTHTPQTVKGSVKQFLHSGQ